MQRRSLLAGAAALPAALSSAAVAQPAQVLKFVPQANLTSLDPIWTTANVTRNHAWLVYDVLYGMDARFQPQPQMAAGHTVEGDGRIWTFTLRDGLLFHDGAFFLDHDILSYRMIARAFDGQAEGLTRDDVLDNITITWLTNTAISGAQLYWETLPRSSAATSDLRGIMATGLAIEPSSSLTATPMRTSPISSPR